MTLWASGYRNLLANRRRMMEAGISSGGPAYYVDATLGNDANDGTSSGLPWKTIAKVNGETFDPGDRILFKRGETWREELTPPSSGLAGTQILFAAYGSGALPIINAASLETGWTAATTSVTIGDNTADTYTGKMEDCSIRQGDDSNYNGVELPVRKTGGFDNRALLRFDLSDIPAGVTISSASLAVTMENDIGANTFYLHTVLQTAWVEDEAKWTEYNTGNGWNTAGCNGNGTDVTGVPETSTGALSTMDIAAGDTIADVKTFTGLSTPVQTALDGSGSFETLISMDAGGAGQQNFYQRGGTDGRRCYLSITYTLPNTFQKAWASNDVVCVEDGTRLAKGTAAAGLAAASFFQTGGVLYVRCSDDADPDTHTMEVANRANAIDGNGVDYIELDGLHFKYAKDHNVELNGNLDWVIRNCQSDAPRASHVITHTGACGAVSILANALNDAGQESVYLDNGIHTAGIVLIDSNTVTDGGWNLSGEGDAIDIKAGNTATIRVSNNAITFTAGFTPTTSQYGIISLSQITAEYNTISNSVRAGIKSTGNGSIIRYNLITNARSGATLPLHGIAWEGDNHQIYYNLLVLTGDTTNDSHGLHGGYSKAYTGVSIYNNTVYGWKRGFYADDAMTSFNMKNNIFAEYTIMGIFLGNPAGLTCDYNCVYTTQGGTNYGRFNGANKAALANWIADTTYGDNSNEADPAFVGEPSDLTIGAGSSCRNVGDDVSLTQDYAGVSVPQEANPAIGAYEYVA